MDGRSEGKREGKSEGKSEARTSYCASCNNNINILTTLTFCPSLRSSPPSRFAHYSTKSYCLAVSEGGWVYSFVAETNAVYVYCIYDVAGIDKSCSD